MPHALIVYPTSRHNAVDVRMVEQIRTPRMEDGRHTRKQSLCSGKGIDGCPGSFEHAIVEDTLMSYSNRMQTRRYSEYDMEVLRRDDFFPAECNPLLPLLVLTLGAMPIPTAIVADADIPTLRTYLHVPTKGTGPALGHVGKSPSDRRYDIMTTKELLSMVSYDLTKVVGCPHFFLGGNRMSIGRTSFCGSMSAT